MKFQVLFFLLLLTSMYLCLAQGSFGNCCLRYAQGMKAKTRKNIESYRMQEADGDCNIRAVVFLMKKRQANNGKQRTVCANPEETWVQNLLETVRRRMLTRN